jgi:hypothetical protein
MPAMAQSAETGASMEDAPLHSATMAGIAGRDDCEESTTFQQRELIEQ